VGPRKRDELRERGCCNAGACGENVRNVAEHNDRRHVGVRIETGVAEKKLVCGATDIAQEERVAVSGGARRGGSADAAARARDVLDINAPPLICRHLIGRDAGDDVGGAAGGKRDDDADGAVGIAAVRARLDHGTGGDGERRCKDGNRVFHPPPASHYFPSNSGDLGQ
jgi:hypothetical protein